MDLAYRVALGPRFELEVVGADRRQLEKRDLLPFLGEAGYDEALLLQSVDQIRAYYQERGYYRVDVRTEEHRQDDVLHLRLEVVPGPKLTLEEVEFEGNASFLGRAAGAADDDHAAPPAAAQERSPGRRGARRRPVQPALVLRAPGLRVGAHRSGAGHRERRPAAAHRADRGGRAAGRREPRSRRRCEPRSRAAGAPVAARCRRPVPPRAARRDARRDARRLRGRGLPLGGRLGRGRVERRAHAGGGDVARHRGAAVARRGRGVAWHAAHAARGGAPRRRARAGRPGVDRRSARGPAQALRARPLLAGRRDARRPCGPTDSRRRGAGRGGGGAHPLDRLRRRLRLGERRARPAAPLGGQPPRPRSRRQPRACSPPSATRSTASPTASPTSAARRSSCAPRSTGKPRTARRSTCCGAASRSRCSAPSRT